MRVYYCPIYLWLLSWICTSPWTPSLGKCTHLHAVEPRCEMWNTPQRRVCYSELNLKAHSLPFFPSALSPEMFQQKSFSQPDVGVKMTRSREKAKFSYAEDKNQIIAGELSNWELTVACFQSMTSPQLAVKVKVTQSCLTVCNPMDYIAHQTPLSMGFSRQEYWSRLPFPSPGNTLDPKVKPRSPTLQADFLLSEPQGKPQENSKTSLNVIGVYCI